MSDHNATAGVIYISSTLSAALTLSFQFSLPHYCHLLLIMAPYTYHPLALPHETRVLTILPGRFGDEMKCKLSHINFESGEKYEALSYCWGGSVAEQLDLNTAPDELDEEGTLIQPTGTVKDLLGHPEHEWLYIKYGGVLPSSTITIDELELPVGGELFRAMQRLRDDKKSLRIWIDAICINQSDLQERTEHVKVMGSIYQNASKVRIWLGDEINLETHVCRALRGLNKIFIELAPKLESQEVSSIDKIILCQSHPNWYQIEWYALAHLFNRAWVTKTSLPSYSDTMTNTWTVWSSLGSPGACQCKRGRDCHWIPSNSLGCARARSAQVKRIQGIKLHTKYICIHKSFSRGRTAGSETHGRTHIAS
jgi:hypothetical protein